MGIKVAQASPSISHLLFRDDSLFFCKATSSQSEVILQILNLYGNASGQWINFEKSAVTFGKAISAEARIYIKNRLGIPTEGGTRKYLGVLEQLQGSKAHVFVYVRD